MKKQLEHASVLHSRKFLLSKMLTGEALGALRDQAGYLHSAVVGVEVVNGALRILFANTVSDFDWERLAGQLADLEKRTIKSFAKVKARVSASNVGSGKYAIDPIGYLQESRQAIEAAPGTFLIQGGLLRVIKGLDAYFLNYARVLGAAEQHMPITVPVSSMAKNGYLSNFPHHALFVSGIHANFDRLHEAAGQLECHVVEANRLSNAYQMLAPTVCYHCFEALNGQDVGQVGTLFTASNSCHRHEGIATEGLRRLQTFTMREIVFLDTEELVGAVRDRILADAVDIFARWEVSFDVMTATDPFFGVGNETKRAFQAMHALKYELRLLLPFDGSTLACASFNHHKDTLVRSYGVRKSGIDRLMSGCVGYGFERIAYALYAQFGPELSHWPRQIRSDLNL